MVVPFRSEKSDTISRTLYGCMPSVSRFKIRLGRGLFSPATPHVPVQSASNHREGCLLDTKRDPVPTYSFSILGHEIAVHRLRLTPEAVIIGLRQNHEGRKCIDILALDSMFGKELP